MNQEMRMSLIRASLEYARDEYDAASYTPRNAFIAGAEWHAIQSRKTSEVECLATIASKPQVTEGGLVDVLCKTTNLFTSDIEEAARALLQQFEIRSK